MCMEEPKKLSYVWSSQQTKVFMYDKHVLKRMEAQLSLESWLHLFGGAWKLSSGWRGQEAKLRIFGAAWKLMYMFMEEPER